MGLVVVSEDDQQPLLVHRICKEDIYQRQGGDTIITWTDPDINTDIALSFQEAEGCNHIWEQIKAVQETYAKTDVKAGVDLPGRLRRGAVDEYEFGNTPGDGIYQDSGRTGPSELPPAELGSLPELVRVVADCSPFAREKIASLVLKKDYLRQLLDLFRICEDLDDQDGLHMMYHLVRGLVLLNDASLFDELLRDSNVMDVVGALEYDPDLAAGSRPGRSGGTEGGGAERGGGDETEQGGADERRAAAETSGAEPSGGETSGETQERVQHRAFLRDSVVFKEVVPIQDAAIRAKIHQTYRIGYLKDVILPRVLDDATFGTLTSIMLFNNVEVVLALLNDPTFLKELFARLRSTPRADPGWDDLVGFLQELCSLAKHLQVQQRGTLFASLVHHGLFHVLTDVLGTDSETSQLKGADVLMSTLHNDPSALRAFLVKQEHNALFSRIVELFVAGEEGLQAQLYELLKLMLDPETMDQPVEKSGLLELFYDTYMDQLVDLVSKGTQNKCLPNETSKSQLDGNVKWVPAWTLVKTIELLCFCVQHHSFRIKYYVLRNNVVEKVLNLMKRREKYLVVAAVRFLRACVGLKDEFYNRYIIKNKLFTPVMKAFAANGSRYNLLNSAVLELVDFIRRENIKNLIAHLVEHHEPMFAEVDYVETFRLLKIRYEQGKQPLGAVPPLDAEGAGAPVLGGILGLMAGGGENQGLGAGSYMPRLPYARPEAVAAQQAMYAARRRRDGSMDKSEEDYFNSEDDDDDHETTTGGDQNLPGPSLQGASDLPPLSERFVPMRSAFSPPLEYNDAEVGKTAIAVVSGEGDEGETNGSVDVSGTSGSKRPPEEGVPLDEVGKRQRQGEENDQEAGLPAAQRDAIRRRKWFVWGAEAVKVIHEGEQERKEATRECTPTSQPTGSWVSVEDAEKKADGE